MGGVHILDTKYSTILQSYCKVADFAFLTHSSGTLMCKELGLAFDIHLSSSSKFFCDWQVKSTPQDSQYSMCNCVFLSSYCQINDWCDLNKKPRALGCCFACAHWAKTQKNVYFCMMISLISSFSDILTSARFVRFFRLILPTAVLGLIGAGSLKNLTF